MSVYQLYDIIQKFKNICNFFLKLLSRLVQWNLYTIIQGVFRKKKNTNYRLATRKPPKKIITKVPPLPPVEGVFLVAIFLGGVLVAALYFEFESVHSITFWKKVIKFLFFLCCFFRKKCKLEISKEILVSF